VTTESTGCSGLSFAASQNFRHDHRYTSTQERHATVDNCRAVTAEPPKNAVLPHFNAAWHRRHTTLGFPVTIWTATRYPRIGVAGYRVRTLTLRLADLSNYRLRQVKIEEIA
jgi:hypothetical protein